MFPLFPFVAGVLTGAVALRLIRTDRTRAGLEKAQERLRDATVSSLEALESASARARKRLGAETGEAAAAGEGEGGAPPAAGEIEEVEQVGEAGAARPARRVRAPRAPQAQPGGAPQAGQEEGEA